MSKNYTVDEAFIKQAHAAACNDWKDKIKAKFPEVFVNPEFEFGQRHELCGDSDNKHEKPLFIGKAWAPEGLSGKCLMFDPSIWKMETINTTFGTAITFTKIKK